MIPLIHLVNQTLKSIENTINHLKEEKAELEDEKRELEDANRELEDAKRELEDIKRELEERIASMEEEAEENQCTIDKLVEEKEELSITCNTLQLQNDYYMNLNDENARLKIKHKHLEHKLKKIKYASIQKEKRRKEELQANMWNGDEY
jgi:putative ABC transport system permease protein